MTSFGGPSTRVRPLPTIATCSTLASLTHDAANRAFKSAVVPSPPHRHPLPSLSPRFPPLQPRLPAASSINRRHHVKRRERATDGKLDVRKPHLCLVDEEEVVPRRPGNEGPD
jgi:hypothetical protein